MQQQPKYDQYFFAKFTSLSTTNIFLCIFVDMLNKSMWDVFFCSRIISVWSGPVRADNMFWDFFAYFIACCWPVDIIVNLTNFVDKWMSRRTRREERNRDMTTDNGSEWNSVRLKDAISLKAHLQCQNKIRFAVCCSLGLVHSFENSNGLHTFAG